MLVIVIVDVLPIWLGRSVLRRLFGLHVVSCLFYTFRLNDVVCFVCFIWYGRPLFTVGIVWCCACLSFCRERVTFVRYKHCVLFCVFQLGHPVVSGSMA